MDHRIRRIIEYALPVQGYVQGIVDYNEERGFYFKGVSSENRATCNPCIIRLTPGKYIFRLTGTTFEYGVQVRDTVPEIDRDYYATPGSNTDLVSFDSVNLLVNTGYLRTDYEYVCDHVQMLTMPIRLRTNKQITTALLEQLSRELTIIKEEA